MKEGRHLGLLNECLRDAASYIIMACSGKSMVYGKYGP